jgi:hypothetical protein
MPPVAAESTDMAHFFSSAELDTIRIARMHRAAMMPTKRMAPPNSARSLKSLTFLSRSVSSRSIETL